MGAVISIDTDLAQTLSAYRVCEFATLGRDGTALSWPAATLLRSDGTFRLTTSISFPQKAFNIRRNERVALLFSDPTGSGLADAPQILIQGTAVCPDEVVASPVGDEAYWSMLFERQPSSRAYLKPPMHWLMDWYYLRLLITVTPTSIVHLPTEAITATPQATGTSTAQPAHGDLRGATQIARTPTAVLGAMDASGSPVLARVRPVAGPDGFTFTTPAEADVSAGPASLMVHELDENLANLMSALVRGSLTPGADGRWSFTPERVVEPMPLGSARDQISLLRQGRSAAKTYLANRGIPRPQVRWDQLRQLVHD